MAEPLSSPPLKSASPLSCCPSPLPFLAVKHFGLAKVGRTVPSIGEQRRCSPSAGVSLAGGDLGWRPQRGCSSEQTSVWCLGGLHSPRTGFSRSCQKTMFAGRAKSSVVCLCSRSRRLNNRREQRSNPLKLPYNVELGCSSVRSQ